MKKFLLAALLLAPLPALGQSIPHNPQMTYGMKPTVGQWNNWFQQKQDTLGYTPLNLSGGVMTGPLTLPPSTSFRSSFNIGPGAAPTTPSNGDVWITATGMFVRIAGVTIGPLSSNSTAPSVLFTNIVEPATPAAGTTIAFVDSTTKTLKAKNDAGVVSTTVIPATAPANQFATAIGAGGVLTFAAPAANSLTNAQAPTMASSTIKGNPTLSTGNQADITMPNCAGGSAALQWSSGTGIICGTVAGVGSAAGFRNRLINGGFNLDQRNVGASVAVPTGTTAFSTDRWFVYSATGSLWTVQQQPTGPAIFPWSLRVQRINGTSGTATATLAQIIENLNMADLAGQTVTLSFWAQAGAGYTGGTLGANCAVGTVSDEGRTLYSGAAWTGFNPILAGSDVLSTTWSFYAHTFTVPSNAKELACNFQETPSGTAGASDYYNIAAVQLELGNPASTFEVLPYSVQLDLARRYYTKTFPYATVPAQNAGVSGQLSQYEIVANTIQNYIWQVPVSLRASPNLVYFNPIAANNQWSAGGQAAATGTGGSVDRISIGFGAPPTLAAGAITSLHVTADAEL